MGGGGPLQAAIRARLRLALLTDTAAYWFPYRSLLGLMNLTHGAWDRVLISFSGSLPSLLSAIWTSAKDRQTDGYALDQVRTGVERRGERAVREKIGPLAQQFRDELNELRVRVGMAELEIQNREITSPAELTGLETLQTESQQIFDREVELGDQQKVQLNHPRIPWHGYFLGVNVRTHRLAVQRIFAGKLRCFSKSIWDEGRNSQC